MRAPKATKAPPEFAASERYVTMTEVVQDPGFQVRKGTFADTVEKYAALMSKGVVFPAVEVADIGGALVLVDGWHRMAAAERIGETDILARVSPRTKEEALWRAAQANGTHGRPLTSGDHHRAFALYVKAKQHRTKRGGFKTYREIAAELGSHKSYSTIRNWMRSDYPAIFRQMRGNAGELPTENPNAGAPPVSYVLLADELRRAMVKAESIAASLKSPEGRGLVVQEAQALIAKVRAMGKVKRPPPAPESDF